ncbi:type II secretion system protein [Cellvibrio fontiphilus]|uniref:Type II secretion system protein n=1 Tax=Cellvibrio fontiphilus TaxID=1815559 RepID=A0ABV7FDX7_9GAMM
MVIIPISDTYLYGDKLRKSSGFTILEMVVVLVMIGLIASLALPGLQKMFDAMEASIQRDNISFALNSLSQDVRDTRTALYFERYPENSDPLPTVFLDRLAELEVKVQAQSPILITASGFCPISTAISVFSGSRHYDLVLRAPDCRVELP